MSALLGNGRGSLVLAALAILGAAGCTGLYSPHECGDFDQACCTESLGSACSATLVCGETGRCNPPVPTYTVGGVVVGLSGSGLVLHNGADTVAIASAGPFTFPTALPPRSPYAVTISAQPTGQICTVSGGSGTVGSGNVTSVTVTCTTPAEPTYTVGGTVSGLTGAGLVLQDNGADNLSIAASGAFAFATPLNRGDRYTVTVLVQPSGQSCTVSNGSGTIGTANVTSVAVSCVATTTPRYTVGGTVSGLTGTGLVLRNNGGDDLSISTNGAFTFSAALPAGSSYAVTVGGQPSGPSQTCTVSNGAGTVGNANVTGVEVHCVTNPVPMFTVGGTVSGLTGPGLVLRNNGGDDLAVASNGTFTFATPLSTGSGYLVTVWTQPSGQTCIVSGGSGTVGGSNVTTVVVSCTTNPPPRYSVGGTVSGLTGAGLRLQNNAGDDLSVTANGPFVFATALTTGSTYAVTVLSQPAGQTCSVSNGSGTIGTANVTTVTVGCVNDPPPTFTVGGTVSGLAGNGLVLQDNGADNLAIGGNGPFRFATALTSGDHYSVTVLSEPAGQTCTVSNGAGTIGGADVTSVAVSCVTNPLPRYHVGGTVSGLAGTGLVLRNNGGDDLAITTNGAFTFATTLLGGAAYAVTVDGQPSGPSQTCTVSNGSGTVGAADVTTVVVSCVTNPTPRYTIGGTATGLSGTGLVLRNNGGDDLAVTSSGGFTFATSLTSGSAYAVTVATQPSGQTCSVSNGSGIVASANVTNVSVACVTNPPPRFTIGGTVTGLTGAGLVLRNNGGDDLAVTANGVFTFATPLTSGSAYAVTITSQPSGQTCSVSSGSGIVASANVTNVSVACVTNTYSVGGTVTGLSGPGLVLRNNGGDDLPVAASGTFTFATRLSSGSAYAVTVAAQPTGQTCTVSNGSGTVSGANVTTVAVACVTNPPPRFTIGGTVAGLTGSGVVLRNNGGDDLVVSTNGAFTFATALTSGSTYAVTVATQPTGQTCTVSNGSGTVSGANVTNVAVVCVTNPPPRFTIGGTVAGLSGAGLVLRNNGGDDLAVSTNGAFTFATSLTSGSTYAVTVATQPTGQTCTVSNGSGTVAAANVTNVSVACVTNPPPRFTIGGTVTGLSGTGLVLRNNGGDDLAVSTNGVFTFATSLTSGSTYAVTVATQPTGQTCTVSNGSGTVSGANVTNVAVACVTNPPPRFTIGGTVAGLTGSGLVLRNNGGDDLAVSTNGAFTFATSLTSGSAYAVTVATQPTGQTCSVSNASGTVAAANVTNVAVACVTNPPPRFTIGGTVAGLTASGLVLRNNGGDDLAVSTNGAFTFATSLTGGSTYAVTVATQPTGQTCTVSNGSGTVSGANVTNVAVVCVTNPPPRFTIGGTLTGLSGTGLVLRNNGGDDLAVSTNGVFTFATALTSGSTYAVTVATQPTGQTCTISNGSGTVSGANVTNVAVVCVTNPPPRFTIGGTVAGLTGSGLVLRNNGGDDLAVSTNGAFTFATSLTSGSTYAVTVATQPTGQTCTVSNGSGTVSGANVTNVAVVCVTNPPPRFTIGGTVAGLSGAGLVLRNNGGDDLAVSTNGAFTFATSLTSGSTYAVTVATQPTGQTCTVSNGSGTVAAANVTNVSVACVTNPPPRFTIGGTVTGLSGTGLVLRNNGGDDLAVSTNGVFTFATSLTSGSTYAVTVATQPTGQTCTVSNGSGTVSGANVTNVAVACVTNPPPRFTIGGTVAGLTGSGLVLRNNGGDDLAVSTNGAFTFATSLTSGSAYAVTVATQPTGQTCSVSNASGTVAAANVTNVSVSCVTNTYTIGGTVTGLSAAGLVLRNNGGDDLAVSSSGAFTFATRLTSGSTYAVTVATQPTGQTCTVSNGSGTVAGANVTTVAVACITNPPPRFTIGGTVAGLSGAGLVLRNNGGDDLAVSTNGVFTFATSLTSGSAYAVTIWSQPTAQTCTVSNGSGTVAGANVTNVSVSCVTNTYTIGGTVTGLSAAGLVLRNNGGDDLAVSSSGAFTFATRLTSGSTYAVTIRTQPVGQTCTVSNGSGTVAGANVTTVAVACITNPPPRFTIGGTVAGLSGAGLVLRNNGGDDLAVSTNGVFTFATSLTSGSAYAVTIWSQPTAQTCTVSNGSGTVAGANVTNVSVSCVTNTYTIGGTVTGLSAAGLVLRNNGGDDLAVSSSGAFTFATRLTSGTTYAVTIATQPTGQTCTVSNGSGTVAGANVTNVSVACVTNTYTVGGTVTGLSASGLVLRNNGGDDLAVSSSGTFTFATRLTSGSTYAVTVATQPTGQTCTVSNGSGTVAGANVTNVSVSCGAPPPNGPTLVQHVSSSTNLIGRGLIANDYRFTLPNPVRSGNVLILGVSYGAPAGQVVTVRDNLGNSWPASPAVSETDPDGSIASAIFVLPNARPGTTTLTVSFSSAIRENIFQYTISEFQGVATAAPVSGASRASGAQPAISAGTFTPANNDASGGNLIWSYFADAYGATAFGTEATRFTAGAGFTLLDADIAWPTGSPPFPHASQYQIQRTAGPVTPSMNVTHNDGGGDVYVGVAVALRASPGAGTSPPPGMRIVHLTHLTNQSPDFGNWRLQFPSSGNLVVMTLQEQNIIPVASVTDNLGNGYQLVAPDDTVPQFWFAQAAATAPTLEITVQLTGGRGGGVTYLLYDVAGASTSSFDGSAFKSQYDDPTGSDVFDTPVITPLSAPGLTITATSLGQGPSSGLAPGCPAGSIFDLVYYTGETDLDTMDNADFRAHVFNTDTSTQHWNIAISNGNNGTNVSSTAVHFK